MGRSVEDRFWSKVAIGEEDECWEWQASEGAHGYGQFRFKGVIDKSHRVSWMIANGDIPDGMWVLHRCSNRLCVNPKHLCLGDAQDSVSETVNKERASYAVRDFAQAGRGRYDPEFVSYEHLMLTEIDEYNASIFKYERKADLYLRNKNVVVLGGYGLKVCVRDGSLSIEYQRGDNSKKVLSLNRGVHKVRNIVVTSKGGFVTLDAIKWLCQQGISLYVIDWRGEIAQTMSPFQNRSARLAYLQYKAYETGLNVEIAKELIRFKAGKQIEALKLLLRRTDDAIYEQFEKRMHQLDYLDDVSSIMVVEAGMAATYWSLFAGIPIKWKFSDLKHIPSHWHTISERLSNISSHGNASQATNPFHAVLNFAYALLECQVMEAINIAGLAPEVGFLHTSDDGGNLLAYDLMECFRSDVDALVLALFQKSTFTKGDFIQWYSGECRLNEELRRYVLAECRIDSGRIDIQCKWLRNMLDRQTL